MISIITVSHGHESDIKKLVFSLSEYMECCFEFILIDNLNSTFDFEGLCQKCGLEKFSIIRNISPMSFSYNNNIGVSLASNETIVLLNPDITLFDTSLSDYLSENIINDGLYYPKLIYPDGSPQIHGKQKPNILDQIVTFFASVFGLKRESPEGSYWYFAAALICNKTFFYKLGGFDLGFPMYAEDAELCDRARALGYPVEEISRVKLMHGLGGESKNKYILKAIYSGLYFHYKSYKNKRLNKG
ncbi:glycosyltransferase family 2 protein [Luteithermobacter gelatinilyticus]|uniref:glycosyltransferase family 2 protein n=1 Tax=Luteithermobacter gelatinilyticus TaxID=2582913 RepID=UPI001106A8AD|nr:glycosyltransferase family 2 protein [Luteithermobacter gelatinilyticus]